MSESNYGQHGNEGPEHARLQPVNQDDQQGQLPAYWKRAHRDWRMWVALVFMLAAITIYILSEDLAFLPHL